MSDALIDPVAGDYFIVNGIPARDPADGLANAVYLRLETPLGSYWADPTLGSRLHELKREKDRAQVAILAKQYAGMALAPLIADGRALAIDISTERTKAADNSGRLNLLIEITLPSGQRRTFVHPVKVL